MSEGFTYQVLDGILQEHGKKPAPSLAYCRRYRSIIGICPGVLSLSFGPASRQPGPDLQAWPPFMKTFLCIPRANTSSRFADGTACHVRKSIPILERLRKELHLSDVKTTTDDLHFT